MGVNSRVEVVVPFVEDGGYYPRAHRRNPALAYWKAIAVMAGTLRIVGADWPVTVSTNRPPTEPTVRRALEAHGVSYRATPFDHRPPPGYFRRFSGSFYLLDALIDAVDRTPSGWRVLVVDPDCVWVRDPAPMLDALRRDPRTILAYEITHAPGALGLTPEELAPLFADIGDRPIDRAPAYVGGELLFGERDRLAELLPHVERIWKESLRRFAAGDRVRANTEEHVLSYALSQVGWPGGTANPYMRRVWTQAPPHRNVQGDEEELVLWHALTEKTWGLPRLFDDLVKGHPDLRQPGAAYRAHLARRLRVRLTPTQRMMQWGYTQLYRRVRGERPRPVEW